MYEVIENIDKQTIEIIRDGDSRRIILDVMTNNSGEIKAFLENLRDRVLDCSFGHIDEEDILSWLFGEGDLGEEPLGGRVGLIQWTSDYEETYEQFIQRLRKSDVIKQLEGWTYNCLIDATISKGVNRTLVDQDFRFVECLRGWNMANYYYMKNDPNVPYGDKQTSKINVLFLNEE